MTIQHYGLIRVCCRGSNPLAGDVPNTLLQIILLARIVTLSR